MLQQRQRSHLLIVGPTILNTKLLIQGIVHSLTNNQQLQDELQKDIQECDHYTLKETLVIVTKYYQAECVVHLANYNKFIAEEVEVRVKSFQDETKIQQLDGVLFITQALKPDKVLGLHEYSKICDAIISVLSPNLQAIIYDRPQGMEIQRQLIEQEEEQLSNYVEAIYEDFSSVKPIKPSASPLSEQDDTTGLMRVIEILQCNVWTGSTTHEQKKPKEKEKQKQKVEELEDEEENIEELANILQQMRGMKGEQLDDEARKQKAEKLLTQLMAACHMDESDDGEDGE